jgi:PQQ-dependent catabolism-associated CXXCW motif protein
MSNCISSRVHCTRCRAIPLAAACLAGLLLLGTPPNGSSRAEPAYDHIDPTTGYRTQRYQAAVPERPPVGERVWIEDIDRLVAQDRAVLVDVSPITGAGYDPATGHWRSAIPHASLPGAVWLPEVGRGVIDANVERFFDKELERLSGANKSRPLILFCNADCWMSWNAMKRAGRLGYTRLYWFPEGTDGWRDWDRKLVPIEPVAIKIEGSGTTP